MMFHIAPTHTETNCPGYDRQCLPAMRQALANRNEIAERNKVRLHWLLSTAPDHTFYTAVEADSQVNVDVFLRELPVPHANRVTPVITPEQLENLAEQLSER